MAKVTGRPEFDFVANDLVRSLNFIRNYGWSKFIRNLSDGNVAGIGQAAAYCANERENIAALIKKVRDARRGVKPKAKPQTAAKKVTKVKVTSTAPATPAPEPSAPATV